MESIFKVGTKIKNGKCVNSLDRDFVSLENAIDACVNASIEKGMNFKVFDSNNKTVYSYTAVKEQKETVEESVKDLVAEDTAAQSIVEQSSMPVNYVVETPYNLRIRTTPDASTLDNYTGKVTGKLDYAIIEEQYDQNGTLWGKLASNAGWIDLSLCNKK